MMATRWQPWAEIRSEMDRLQNEMGRLFEQWGTNAPEAFRRREYPPLNLWEDDNSLYAEAELPGFDLKGMEIYVSGDNQLTIKGERKPPQVGKATWHRRERGHGSFQRTVDLPHYVDSEKVGAEFNHGVLTITLPKREEAKPRRIEVKPG